VASSNTTLAVKFTGNADDLIRVVDQIKRDMGDMSGNVDASFAKVSSSADKHTSKIKSAFAGMKSSLMSNIGSTIGMVGIGGLAFGIADSVKAAEAAQAQMASFGAQLKAVGITSKGTVGGINSMIDSMSTASGITAPHLEAAYNQLIRATKDTTSAHQYLSLSLDIAAAKNTTVEQAANLVSRAYVSGGTSLRRYGINVVTVTTAQTHLKDVIAAYTAAHGKMDQAEKDHFATLMTAAKLTDKHTQAVAALAQAQKVFAGQESAREGTAVAEQQRLANAIEQLQVAFGKMILPVIVTVIPVITTLTSWMAKHTAIVKILIPVLASLAAIVVVVSAATKVWTAIQTVLNVVLSANPIGIVIIALAALALAVYEAYQHSATFRDIVGEVWSVIQSGAGVAVTAFQVIEGAIGLVLIPLDTLISGLKTAVGWFTSLTQSSTAAQRSTLPGSPTSTIYGPAVPTHHASGGVVPGPAGAGDVVPAMLTPGEVVLNSAQQQMIGPSNIMRALSATGGMIGGTRFASGGMAGLSGSQQTGAKAIIDVFTKYGLDPAGGIAVALNESSLNPTAVGDGGTSFGLFQLHQGGALGSHSKAWAFDPVNNATAAAVADVAAGGRGLGGRALQLLQTKAFERPSNPTADDSSANYSTAASIVSGAGGASAVLSPKAKAAAAAKDKKKTAAWKALHKKELARDKVAAANTARAAALGTSSDPVIQRFEALEMEDQISGNTAGDTKLLTQEKSYVQKAYDKAVKSHNYGQVTSLGQVLQGLISAIAQNTTTTAANTAATTVNTNAVTGSTSISANGQDYAVGGTSSGNLANLAVGT
jgi:hypothetical protein